MQNVKEMVAKIKESSGSQTLLQAAWPSVFDPECHEIIVEPEPPEPIVRAAFDNWQVRLTETEFQEVCETLQGQDLRIYNPWNTVYPFGIKGKGMSIIVDGTYVRVFARIGADLKPNLFPVFQPIESGAILTPTALGNQPTSGVVEMCVCVKEGCVIHVNNPAAVLRIEEISRAVAKSRDRDALWLRESMFALQETESRIVELMRSLTAWKELDEDDNGFSFFANSLSQNAIADALDMSDNTLRPYLKDNKYGFYWESGRLMLTPKFVGEAKAGAGRLARRPTP